MAARTNVNLGLREFKGSTEEKIVQNTFRAITEYTDFARFLNLEIHKCNAEEGTSFSDAHISLQSTYESTKLMKSSFVSGCPECLVVEIKDMLDTNILDSFRNGGVDAIEKYPKPGVGQSFMVLFKYLRKIERHEKDIGNLIDKNSAPATKKMEIMAGLAHHLFSQLVPGKEYEVDDTKPFPNMCTCGCYKNICGGDTSLGSVGTWHGRVDIMVKNRIAVMVDVEQTTDDEEDDMDEDEPERKYRKTENIKTCDVCVEGKSSKSLGARSVLLSPKNLKQILTVAITNGFAQVNDNQSKLSGFLIPTFGATSDHVSVCLYDPENDCLLHIKDELKLSVENFGRFKLDPQTVITIWILLNFPVFTVKDLCSDLALKNSGLHEQLNEDLYYYKETKLKTNYIVQPPSDPWQWLNMTVVYNRNK